MNNIAGSQHVFNGGFPTSQPQAFAYPDTGGAFSYQASRPKQPTPPTKYPMAAPPLPLTPTYQQPAGTSTAGSSPRAPLSPGSQSREQSRVSLLLELNVDLLQEVNRLQAEGKGGATSPQHQAQLKQQGQPDTLASEEYIQCLRRVQANLGYLMPKAQNDPHKTVQGPMHMTPPPHMPQLQSKYDQLSQLFPGWQGLDSRASQSTGSPNPNGTPGNGMNGTSPVAAGAVQA